MKCLDFCAVPWCMKHRKRNLDIGFFYFPRNESKRNEWKSLLNVENVTKKSVVCQIHFSKDLFCTNETPGGRLRLLRTAMPNRFLRPTEKIPKFEIERQKRETLRKAQEQAKLQEQENLPCRLCLQPLDLADSMNLFYPKGSFNLAQKLMTIFQLQLEETDGWPSSACRRCVDVVTHIETFKATVVSSHCILYNQKFASPKKRKQIAKRKFFASSDPLATLSFDLIASKCTKCHREFQSPDQLRQHRAAKECHFTCEVCGKTSRTSSHMTKHKRIHLPRDQRPVPCNACPKRFNDKAALQRHVERIHDVQGRCVCEVCGKVMTNRSNLLAHIKNVHRTSKPLRIRQQLPADAVNAVQVLTCTLCGRGTKLIAMHTRTVHRIPYVPTPFEAEKVPCGICDRLVSRHGMYTHQWVRHVRKPLKCEVCQMEFVKFGSYQAHMDRFHLDTKYPCQHCDKVNRTQQGQYLHMKSHHPEEYRELGANGLGRGRRTKSKKPSAESPQ